MIKELFKNKLFLIGLVVKFTALFFFAWHFPRDLFIPFLDKAVTNFGENPWSLLPPQYFPYGTFLFSILFIPKAFAYLVFGPAALGTTAFSLFLLKTPLLIFDVLFLLVLAPLAGERKKHLLQYYWLNPILFFITYVYGQLDIVSMCLCIASLCFLISRRTALSAILMALATLSKFHVVAIIPLVLVFMWNRDFRTKAVKNISQWSLIWLALSALGFAPILLANKFGDVTVTSPEALRIFGANLDLGGGGAIYLGIAMTALILGRLVISTTLREQGLIFGAAAVFSSILLSTYPGAGWYYWCIPFYSLLFVLYTNIPRSIFALINIFYLIHYAIVLELVPENTLIKNVTFTLLQTSLVVLIITLWVVVIRNEAPVNKRASPFKVGLAGDSGSGKNHLSSVMKDIFNPKNCLMIEGDNYHRWERGEQQWENYTHLNPKANHLLDLANHLTTISKGASIFKSIYSHTTGRFTEAMEFLPSKTLIVQGLHTFFLKNMRDNFDLKIFMKPDPRVRLAWKIRRDVIERGYKAEKVLEQFDRRKKDSDFYIVPQEAFADLIVEFIPDSEYSEETARQGTPPTLAVSYTLWNDVEVTALTEAIKTLCGCDVEVELLHNNMDRVKLTIRGNPRSPSIQQAAWNLFPHLRQLTRGYEEPRWHDGQDGLHQLMILQLVDSMQMRTVGV